MRGVLVFVWLSCAAAVAPPAARRCVDCAASGDLESAFGWLEEARRGRDAGLGSAWGALLVALAERRSPAVLRCVETMFHDGLGFDDLDGEAVAALRGLVPPAVGLDDEEEEEIAPWRRVFSRGRRRRMDAPADAVEAKAPELWVEAKASVRAVDCDGSESAAEALAAARAAREPVILRGVGARWPAVTDSWDAETIAAAFPAALVCRVSPSLGVSFCRESHPRVASGAAEPPSKSVVLAGPAAARRLRGEPGLRRVVYGDAPEEHLYVQALAPPSLLRDVDLGFIVDGNAATPPARLWACRGGVFSPLHFDAQDSHLVQITGEKRVLLWPPEALPALRPYASASHLARRLRVDVCSAGAGAAEAALVRGDDSGLPVDADADADADAARPPTGDAAYGLVRSGALEALIGPGDALWFPSDWAHHTEARGPLSVALSLREVGGEVVGA